MDRKPHPEHNLTSVGPLANIGQLRQGLKDPQKVFFHSKLDKNTKKIKPSKLGVGFNDQLDHPQ